MKLARSVSELIKIRQTLLLLLAMYAGFAAGGGFYSGDAIQAVARAVLAGVLGFTAIAATTALNMVYDMDIDSVMERTKGRPLPRGELNPHTVKIVASVLLAASITVSFITLGFYYTAFMILGFVFDIYAYTIASKRRTWLSIFLGSVAGMAPALGGYALAKGYIDAVGAALALLIASWIPSHIWLLVIHYIDDYRRANIPMLPVALDPRLGVIGSAASIAATMADAITLYLLGGISLPALILGIAISAAALIALRTCKPGKCLLPFKLVNVSLAVYILGVISVGIYATHQATLLRAEARP